MYSKKTNFKIKVKYPSYENYNRYEHKKAEVCAKILSDILSPCDINCLITKLAKEKKR